MLELAAVAEATPLVRMAHPAPAYKRFVVQFLSKFPPIMTMPAPMSEEVNRSYYTLGVVLTYRYSQQRFFKMQGKVEAFKNDFLRQPEGAMKDLWDIVSEVCCCGMLT